MPDADTENVDERDGVAGEVGHDPSVDRQGLKRMRAKAG